MPTRIHTSNRLGGRCVDWYQVSSIDGTEVRVIWEVLIAGGATLHDSARRSAVNKEWIVGDRWQRFNLLAHGNAAGPTADLANTI